MLAGGIRFTHMLILLAVAMNACGDTTSAAVGRLRLSVPQNVTTSVVNPFETGAGVLDADGVASQLAADGADGDSLHVWTGRHFNSYFLSDGVWRILGTETSIPEDRLSTGAGSTAMVTRKSSGETTLTLYGRVLEEPGTEITVPASSWALIGCPYARDLTLADLSSAGALSGDSVKLWNKELQTWETYTLQAQGWTGLEGDSTVVPCAEAFLFHNAASEARTLTFEKPD